MLKFITKDKILFICPFSSGQNIGDYQNKKLVRTLKSGFSAGFDFEVYALSKDRQDKVADGAKCNIITSDRNDLISTAVGINDDHNIKLVIIQYEPDIFKGEYGENFLYLLYTLKKPVVIKFTEIQANPDQRRKQLINSLVYSTEKTIVSSCFQKNILVREYNVKPESIQVIATGVPFYENNIENLIEEKDRKKDGVVISAFTKTGPDKGIEMILHTVANLKNVYSDITCFIIGEQDKSALKHEMVKFSQTIKSKLSILKLENHVKFIENELSMNELSAYIKSSDVLFFPEQKKKEDISNFVSLGFCYGCPVIASSQHDSISAIHPDKGIFFQKSDPTEICEFFYKVLEDQAYRRELRSQNFHRISGNAWENIAIQYMHIVSNITQKRTPFIHSIPELSAELIFEQTGNKGTYRYDESTNEFPLKMYHTQDNANVLYTLCKLYEINPNAAIVDKIETCLYFLENVLQTDGNFITETNEDDMFYDVNPDRFSEQINCNALLALGKILVISNLPKGLHLKVMSCFKIAQKQIKNFRSAEAISKSIKALFFYNKFINGKETENLISSLSGKLVENYTVYDFSEKQKMNFFDRSSNLFHEAMLYSFKVSGKELYKILAKISFDFMLGEVFKIDNKQDFVKLEKTTEVSNLMESLDLFYSEFKDDCYKQKIHVAFTWFLGNNKIEQNIFNHPKALCFKGINKDQLITLADNESNIYYLKARAIFEKHYSAKRLNDNPVSLVKNVSRKVFVKNQISAEAIIGR